MVSRGDTHARYKFACRYLFVCVRVDVDTAAYITNGVSSLNNVVDQCQVCLHLLLIWTQYSNVLNKISNSFAPLLLLGYFLCLKLNRFSYSAEEPENEVKSTCTLHPPGMSHLHLQLFGGCGLQLGGDGALQRVSNQRQALAAVVGNGQNLTFHSFPVHPVALWERKESEGGSGGGV